MKSSTSGKPFFYIDSVVFDPNDVNDDDDDDDDNDDVIKSEHNNVYKNDVCNVMETRYKAKRDTFYKNFFEKITSNYSTNLDL